MNYLKLLVVFFVPLFSGCVNIPSTGPVELSPDTYMISGQADPSLKHFGNLKAEVIREANAFAQSKGKIAIPLGTTERPAPNLFVFHTFEYQFRVVGKDDPEARRTSLTPRADLVVEKTEKIDSNIRSQTQDITPKQTDLYTELTKLDDLRKRGILSEAEFEEQKRILLNRK